MRENEKMVQIPLKTLKNLREGYRVLGFNTDYLDEIIKENEEKEEEK